MPQCHTCGECWLRCSDTTEETHSNMARQRWSFLPRGEEKTAPGGNGRTREVPALFRTVVHSQCSTGIGGCQWGRIFTRAYTGGVGSIQSNYGRTQCLEANA